MGVRGYRAANLLGNLVQVFELGCEKREMTGCAALRAGVEGVEVVWTKDPRLEGAT